VIDGRQLRWMISAVSLRLLYLSFHHLLGLLLLIGRTSSAKDIGLLVLRHEVAVLRRTKPKPAPPELGSRAVFAALVRRLPRALRAHHLVTPNIIVRWHEMDLPESIWPPTHRRHHRHARREDGHGEPELGIPQSAG
jgi:putative transposase